jgi:RND family efflux transporter MFP subunit
LSALGRLPVGSRGEIALAAPFDGTIVRLLGSPGQTVAAGSPVAEISQVSTIWIRVPLFAGELATLDLAKPAQVAHLGQESSGPWRRATRVTGPPTADPAAATIDLFFEAANADNALRLGERVSVRLVLSGDSQERAILVPASAVVYDVHGGTWVYQNTGPHVFVRRRVELGGRSGESVVVRRGLPVGVKVVTAGAAELYGTEFFVSK